MRRDPGANLGSGGCIPDAAVNTGFIVADIAVVSLSVQAGSQAYQAADRLDRVHQGRG